MRRGAQRNDTDRDGIGGSSDFDRHLKEQYSDEVYSPDDESLGDRPKVQCQIKDNDTLRTIAGTARVDGQKSPEKNKMVQTKMGSPLTTLDPKVEKDAPDETAEGFDHAEDLWEIGCVP